mgnify:CR=1 FL=1
MIQPTPFFSLIFFFKEARTCYVSLHSFQFHIIFIEKKKKKKFLKKFKKLKKKKKKKKKI